MPIYICRTGATDQLIKSMNPQLNVLPKDGQASYRNAFLDDGQCTTFFNALSLSLQWQADELIMFGQKIITRRKVAWVGDPDCSYTYSGMKKNPQPWTSELLLIKSLVEETAECTFNSCLLNLYHNGEEGMGWHSDDEKELDGTAPIASLSLGATRKFAFRHKQDKTGVSLFLENGSLLIMHAPTQQCWQHSLLKTRTAVAPRINLTFRKILLK